MAWWHFYKLIFATKQRNAKFTKIFHCLNKPVYGTSCPWHHFLLWQSSDISQYICLVHSDWDTQKANSVPFVARGVVRLLICNAQSSNMQLYLMHHDKTKWYLWWHNLKSHKHQWLIWFQSCEVTLTLFEIIKCYHTWSYYTEGLGRGVVILLYYVYTDTFCGPAWVSPVCLTV